MTTDADPLEIDVDEPLTEVEAVERAFGAENRARLLEAYFSAATDPVIPATAWQHVYRLLLWIDKTTGLAHCYESDKCQPGRPWYARSLGFHGWVAERLGTTPSALVDQIDWLFGRATADLAVISAASNRAEVTVKQRAPYADLGFPEPGDDPELAEMITSHLSPWLTTSPPAEDVRSLVRLVQAHITKENKRKNLVGEGFEDTLAAILERTPGIAERYEIYTRPHLHHLPGFFPPVGSQKVREVDVALVRHADKRRILVTAKWSVRSDREEQFRVDFGEYAKLESAGQDFDYVLVTNEFDAARLVAACDNRRENAPLFADVVHMNPEAPVVAYKRGPKARGNAITMMKRVDEGRLASLEAWLLKLGAQPID
jgi:hypothetical protein